MSRALLLLTLALVFGVEAKGDLSPRELFKPPSDPLSCSAKSNGLLTMRKEHRTLMLRGDHNHAFHRHPVL